MNKEKYDKTVACLEKPDFSGLYELIDNEGENSLISWVAKISKSKSRKLLRAFIKYDVTNEHIFVRYMSSFSRFDEFLNSYYSNKVFDAQIEEYLARHYTVKFINAIKHNIVFTYHNAGGRMQEYRKWNIPAIKPHLIIWENLKSTFDNFWEKIEKLTEQILSSKMTSVELFHRTVKWLEEKRWAMKGQSEIEVHKFQVQLKSVYSMIVSCCMCRLPKPSVINEKVITDIFLNTLPVGAEPDGNIVSELLGLLMKYDEFIHSLLYEYCFGKNTIASYDIVSYCNIDCDSMYRKNLDDIRYLINGDRYLQKTKNAYRRGRFPALENLKKQNDKKTYKENIEFNLTEYARHVLFTDLQIPSLIVNGKQREFFELFQPLSLYSFNRRVRYERELLANNDCNWVTSYKNLVSKMICNPSIISFPYMVETIQSFSDGVSGNSFRYYDDDLPRDILDVFSFNLVEKRNTSFIDSKYKVEDNPFINISGYYLCPTMFFADIDPFYIAINKALSCISSSVKDKDIKARKKELLVKSSKNFEKQLAHDIQSNCPKLRVEWVGNESFGCDGEPCDVDVIVSDQNTSLLIQVKRTKYRQNLRERYLEKINVDKKASIQLNNAEKFLNQKNDIHQLKNNVRKWIVSTTYENSLSEFDGCVKVNFFDLIHVCIVERFETVEALISFVEHDIGLMIGGILQTKKITYANNPFGSQELFDRAQNYRSNFLPRVPLFDPLDFTLVFGDSEISTNLRNSFIQLVRNNNNVSVELWYENLKSFNSKYPSFYPTYPLLVQIALQLRHIEDAQKYYYQGIEIIPDDPNMIKSLKQIDQLKDTAIQMNSKYWYLGEL